MKKITPLILIFSALLLVGCDTIFSEKVTYYVNVPVYADANELANNAINVTSETQQITNYGKICYYEGYLYIAESGKGVHIVNNTDPSNPQIVGFIELQGNADLAIRQGQLYADSYNNLVWFDISNPALPEVKGQLANVFGHYLPPVDNEYRIDNEAYIAKENKVIVDWKVEKRTYRESRWSKDDSDVMYTANSGGSGVNGSMSRFGLYKDYLYVVMNNQMNIFNISVPDDIKKVTESFYVGFDVETIFSYGDNMFMGTPTGLLIYSVENPEEPSYMSMISHVYGCDPVVVEDDLAYVTIHSGNACGQNNNELFVIDVSDVKNPKQLVSYTMTRPKGLGIDNKTLFVCDEGLKIFNATDPQKIIANELAHYTGMDGFDVIPFNNTLMMIADDGLYQYDYTDINDIKQISKLPIQKK